MPNQRNVYDYLPTIKAADAQRERVLDRITRTVEVLIVLGTFAFLIVEAAPWK